MLKVMEDKYGVSADKSARVRAKADEKAVPLNVWTRHGWLYGAPHEQIGRVVELPKPIPGQPVKNEAQDCFRELCFFADWCERDFGIRASLFVLHGFGDVGIVVPETVDVASSKFAVELILGGWEVVRRYVGTV